MDFLDWIGVPENIEKIRQAGISIVESGVSSALGKLEMDLQPRILDPIAATVRGLVDYTCGKLDETIDKQIKKAQQFGRLINREESK